MSATSLRNILLILLIIHAIETFSVIRSRKSRHPVLRMQGGAARVVSGRVLSRSGECPAIDPKQDMDERCKDSCDRDVDCPKYEKCCDVGCGMKCVLPVGEMSSI